MSGEALSAVPVIDIDISGFTTGTPAGRREVVTRVGDACGGIGLAPNYWPHRVVNPPANQRHRGRISIPCVAMPAWGAVVECVPTCRPATGDPAYQPVLAGPHAEERRTGARPAMAV